MTVRKEYVIKLTLAVFFLIQTGPQIKTTLFDSQIRISTES